MRAFLVVTGCLALSCLLSPRVTSSPRAAATAIVPASAPLPAFTNPSTLVPFGQWLTCKAAVALEAIENLIKGYAESVRRHNPPRRPPRIDPTAPIPAPAPVPDPEPPVVRTAEAIHGPVVYATASSETAQLRKPRPVDLLRSLAKRVIRLVEEVLRDFLGDPPPPPPPFDPA